MSDKLSWEVKPSLSRWKKLFQANKMKQAPEEGKVYKPNSSCSILKKEQCRSKKKNTKVTKNSLFWKKSQKGETEMNKEQNVS